MEALATLKTEHAGRYLTQLCKHSPTRSTLPMTANAVNAVLFAARRFSKRRTAGFRSPQPPLMKHSWRKHSPSWSGISSVLLFERKSPLAMAAAGRGQQ